MVKKNVKKETKILTTGWIFNDRLYVSSRSKFKIKTLPHCLLFKNTNDRVTDDRHAWQNNVESTIKW